MKNQSNRSQKSSGLKQMVILLIFLPALIFSIACEDDPAGSSIINIFPWDGLTTNVARPNLYVQFNKSLDSGTNGLIEINGITYSISGTNCDMTFTTTSKTNDTVILDPGGDAGDPVELSGTRSSLRIYGFKDSEGNTIPMYTNTDYEFTAPDI